MLGLNKKIDSSSDADKKDQMGLLREVLENTKSNIDKTLKLLESDDVDEAELMASLNSIKESSDQRPAINGSVSTDGRVVEGVFNGEKMIGADGQEYNVPPNYASKSKLVEGDILKLTISDSGSFIYKQIGPISRKQVVSMLVRNDGTGDWYAMADGKKWKLLTAAVTYFQGTPGDEVVILIPSDSRSTWAAVENIIKITNHSL